MLQASSGRSDKQKQEQNSPNLGTKVQPTPVQTDQSAHKIHGLLKQKAIINIADTASSLDISLPTARKTLKLLADIDIVKEIKGTGKTKLYVYHRLIELLEEGTNPIDY